MTRKTVKKVLVFNFAAVTFVQKRTLHFKFKSKKTCPSQFPAGENSFYVRSVIKS